MKCITAAALLLSLLAAPHPARAANGLQLQWSYSFNNGIGRAQDVTTDLEGNVYMTGSDGVNIWVSKQRGNNGGIMWSYPYFTSLGISLGIGFGHALAWDQANTDLIVLAVDASTLCWVTKLDPESGNPLPAWTNGVEIPGCYGGSPIYPDGGKGVPPALAVDGSGNIYVGAAPVPGSPGSNFLVFKLGPNGNVMGTLAYSNAYNGGGQDTLHDLAVTGAGVVYAIEESSTNASQSVHVVESDPTFSYWEADSTVASHIGWPTACCRHQGVKIGPDGSIYAAGQYGLTPNTLPANHYLWFQKWGPTDTTLSSPLWPAVDSLNVKNTFSTHTITDVNSNNSTDNHFHSMYITSSSICNGSIFVVGDVSADWVGRFSYSTTTASLILEDNNFDRGGEHGDAVTVDSQGLIYSAGLGTAGAGGIFLDKWYDPCATTQVSNGSSSAPTPPSSPPNTAPLPTPPPNPALYCDAYAYPNPKPRGQSTTIKWQLPLTGSTDVNIYDRYGNIVWNQDFTSGSLGGTAGWNQISWDGQTSRGQAVMGMYSVSILSPSCNKTFYLGVLH